MTRYFLGIFDVLASTGPILRRELIGILRTRRAFWITVLTVGTASLVPLLSWPSEGDLMSSQKAIWALMVYQWVFGIAFFLFVPLVTGSSITTERERGTYEPLFNTLIRPAGIVLGKIFAATGFFLLLVIFSFPMVCILYFLGGIDGRYLLVTLCGSVLNILYYGLVGLWASMRSDRTTRAVMTAMLFLIIFNFLFYIVVGILSVSLGFVGGGVGPEYIMFTTYGIYGLVCIFFIISLLRNARYPDLPVSRRRERRALKARESGESKVKIGVKAPARTWFTKRILKPSKDGIPDGWNPVFVMSVRTEMFGQAKYRRALFFLVFLILLLVEIFALMFGANSLEKFQSIFLIDCMIIIYFAALLLPGPSSSVVTSERELGKLDLLRGTLLTPYKILCGKFLAILFGASGLFILGALYVGFHVPFVYMEKAAHKTGGFLNTSVLSVYISFIACVLCVILVSTTSGLLASTLVRRTVPALIFSYVFSIGFLFVLPGFIKFFSDMPLSPAFEFFEIFPDNFSVFNFLVTVFYSLFVASGQFLLAVLIFRKWRVLDN